MFFNVLVLTRKGPLGKIWLAAHYRKKLSKRDIIKVNVSESVDAILDSRIKLSLRTSAHLLYGITYLLSKQVGYLLSDALEYAYNVPQFTSNGNIDLEEQLENYNQINLTVEDNLDFNLTQENPDAPVDFKLANLGQVYLQGEAAEILCDEFSEMDTLRNATNESIINEEIIFEDHVFLDDGFGGQLDRDPTSIFDLPGPSYTRSTLDIQDDLPKPSQFDDPFADDIPTQPYQNEEAPVEVDLMLPPEEVGLLPPPEEAVNVDRLSPRAGLSDAGPSMEEPRQPSAAGLHKNAALDEELVLEPLDETVSRPKRRKLVRGRLIIDEVNQLPQNFFRSNVRDAQTSELDLAPPSRHLMLIKNSLKASTLLKAPEKCFSLMQKKLYESHLKIIAEDFERDDESTVIDEENINDGRFNPELNNLDNIPMEGLTPPPSPLQRPNQEPIVDPIVDEVLNTDQPNEPEIQPSQEKAGSQRRRKRPRLSQEQARRGTLFEPELLHHDENIQFEKTHVDGDPIPEDDWLYPSQTTSEYQSTPEEGLLSQLSQTLSQPVPFSQLTQNYNRKKAALTFYQLLALHKQCIIILEQEKLYEEIYVTKGPNFRGTVSAI